MAEGWGKMAEMLGTTPGSLKRYCMILGPFFAFSYGLHWYVEKNYVVPQQVREKEAEKQFQQEQEKRRAELFAANPNAKAIIEAARERARLVDQQQ